MFATRILLCFILVMTAQAQRRKVPSEYPFLSHIPKTSFDCKKHSVGYFADADSATRCQVYHMCDMKGNKFSYLCPNGTLFHQQLLICAHWYQVNCTKAVQLYEVNKLMFPYERFKPDPTDRLHKHERPSLQPANVLVVEESSTFESSRQITKRPFPPFQQFRQFPREILKSELQTQQTNIVETVVNKFQPQSTTELFSTTDLFSTTNQPSEAASDVSDIDDTTVDPSFSINSTPWWSQFDPHNLPPAPTLRPEMISQSTSQKITQLVANTQDDHNSKIIIKSDDFALKFPKLGDSNLLIDLPINEKCPLCHPHFIQDGHCSPCVIIRR